MSTFNKSKTEIRNTIDELLYGDAGKQTSWSEMIADAMLEKRYHRLADFVSHGKGFNDTSKEAFCKLLDVSPVYTQKGIDSLIAQHCDVALDVMLLERKLASAKAVKKSECEALTNKFGNGDELVAWIDTLIIQGFKKLVTNANKTFLVNEHGNGYKIPRTAIKKYAEATLKALEVEAQLA
jgi:hypothetical protein